MNEEYRPTGRPEQYELPIDAVASEVHYLDHLAPVWQALPREKRGRLYVAPALVERAAALGLAAEAYGERIPGEGPALVSSYADLKRLIETSAERPLALMEHGVGFRFGGYHASYCGGRGWRRVVSLFLCPNEWVARANRNAYPDSPQAVVGCPKLDAWHLAPPKVRSERPVIAVGFHWDCRLCPETRTAWPFFKDSLPALAARYKVIGHAHPRIIDELAPQYEAMGIEVVRDFAEILERADLYVNDCSSTLYEFASLDRPVVLLNAPIYRRHVRHGLRFWEHCAVGVNCNDPAELLGSVERALEDDAEQRARRRKVIKDLYPNRGRAAELAAAALVAMRRPVPGQAPATLSRLATGEPRIHVVCQNYPDERIIPRMARALHERLGWSLGTEADPKADVNYLSGYFEAQRLKAWPPTVASYFTHREEEPPGNAKARLFDRVAERVQLRVATCRLYAEPLRRFGPTVQCAAPLERERFTIAPPPKHARPVVGFSGYTYANRRKGEDLVQGILASPLAKRLDWRASGRGWPVPTRGYAWEDMPCFYQGLDVLVCPSRVEGIPMPPLEALACGVSVVIPRHVGLLDELPDLAGIYRYERGDLGSLLQALEAAAFPEDRVDREALREATAPYSVEQWCEDHRRAFAAAFGEQTAKVENLPSSRTIHYEAPIERGTGSQLGIYCVAFGEPARQSALTMIESVKRHMPDVPVCLCAARPLGPEDVFVAQPDSDVGGRRAKLRAYELAPAEWQSFLYLDVDTVVVAPIYQYFDWVADGWELVICRDINAMQTLERFERKACTGEVAETLALVGTSHTLQYNGGAWACRRSPRVESFFRRWREEWERYAQRDQGALLRALHLEPLRTLVLGSEWNTFPTFQPEVRTAGLLHYPGAARRWVGAIPGRIDDAAAWALVDEGRSELQPRVRTAAGRRG